MQEEQGMWVESWQPGPGGVCVCVCRGGGGNEMKSIFEVEPRGLAQRWLQSERMG